MKKVFWLMSAIGLAAVAQSGVAQSTYSNSSNYVATVIDDDIDSAINNLISSGNKGTRAATYSPSTTNFATSNNRNAGFSSTGIAAQLTSNSAPSIAAKMAARAAHGSSQGRCALYVRRALQAAGYEFTPQKSAYMYANGTLASAGFVKISNHDYAPQVGDIAVFNRSGKNPHGHIQIYDGNQWVSDFRQPKFSPYTQHNGYTVWRDARYVDASAKTGTMLAFNDK